MTHVQNLPSPRCATATSLTDAARPSTSGDDADYFEGVAGHSRHDDAKFPVLPAILQNDAVPTTLAAIRQICNRLHNLNEEGYCYSGIAPGDIARSGPSLNLVFPEVHKVPSTSARVAAQNRELGEAILACHAALIVGRESSAQNATSRFDQAAIWGLRPPLDGLLAEMTNGSLADPSAVIQHIDHLIRRESLEEGNAAIASMDVTGRNGANRLNQSTALLENLASFRGAMEGDRVQQQAQSLALENLVREITQLRGSFNAVSAAVTTLQQRLDQQSATVGAAAAWQRAGLMGLATTLILVTAGFVTAMGMPTYALALCSVLSGPLLGVAAGVTVYWWMSPHERTVT